MSTRSKIAVKKDDRYNSIYCHWDGYPEGVGATLKTHYNTMEKIENLIALGSLSSLGANLGTRNNVTNPEGTEAHARDMKSDHIAIDDSYCFLDLFSSAVQLSCEFLYVFEDGKWKYYDVRKIESAIESMNNEL